LRSGSASIENPATPFVARSWRRTARDPRNSRHVEATLFGGMLEANTTYSASGSSGATCFHGDFIAAKSGRSSATHNDDRRRRAVSRSGPGSWWGLFDGERGVGGRFAELRAGPAVGLVEGPELLPLGRRGAPRRHRGQPRGRCRPPRRTDRSGRAPTARQRARASAAVPPRSRRNAR
jgi:hypothetical protein